MIYAYVSAGFVLIVIMSESMGGVLSGIRFPPCYTLSNQCGIVSNNLPTSENIVTSLNAISRKLLGAKYFAEEEIEPFIEEEWVMVERKDIVIEDEYHFDQQNNGLSLGNCSIMQSVYERLNELANYIELTGHDRRTNIEDNMKSKLLEWQDEIYRCMCEMKILLESLNCGSCSAVPSGNLSTYFQNNFYSEFPVDQQLAVYFVVLKGINYLTRIQLYVQQNL